MDYGIFNLFTRAGKWHIADTKVDIKFLSQSRDILKEMALHFLNFTMSKGWLFSNLILRNGSIIFAENIQLHLM